MTLCKWFIYMILLALSPVIFRLVIAFFVAGKGVRWVSISDIVTFGLILAITNISGLETSTPVDDPSRTLHIGVSLLLVGLFALLFTVSCFMELPAHPIQEDYVLYGATFVATISVGFSYMIWSRILAMKQ
jgi:hypothetical protein